MSQHARNYGAARKRLGRQGIWDAIRSIAPAPFTGVQLQSVSTIPATTVREYIAGLVAAGYVARTAEAPPTYRLIRDVGVEAPRVDKAGNPVVKGSAEEQMWRTMKIMGGDWSHLDLAVVASLDNSAVSEAQALAYTQALAQAGYLRQVGNAKTAPRRYRFIPQKGIGALAPIVARVRVVFDPNLGEIVWHAQVES